MGRVDSFDSDGCVGRTDGVGRVGWVDCADCLGFLGCTDSVGCVGCGGTELGLVSPLLVVDAGVVFGVSELETDVCTLLFLSFGTGFIGSILGVETVDPLCEESNIRLVVTVLLGLSAARAGLGDVDPGIAFTRKFLALSFSE